MAKHMNRATRQLITSRLVAVTVFVAVVSAVVGIGEAQNAPGGRGGAPAEAITACEDKSSGDACLMTLPGDGETVSGECTTTPDNQVACLPEGAPRPPKS